MGPTLIQRISRAREMAGASWKIYAVSRFSNPEAREKIEAAGAETISADLLDEQQLASLPDCPNIIYMVGMKFGATDQEPLTWAMNAYLSGRVADRFSSSRIVAFSTGNVYPLVPVDSGGSREVDPPDPVGEYAQSCLGRERIFQHFSLRNTTPVCLLRLNYAVEARYGVLLDIAINVYQEDPVSLDTGYVNVIWQGDANSVAFRSLSLCASPAEILNVTGPDILSVRAIAEEFGGRFGREPVFSGEEQPSALLNDASRCHELFGQPRVEVEEVMDLIAHWITIDGKLLGKPTKFEVRDGKF
ncbi:MAG TPA: NAD-dependent epimerase/dehydratase family protein [bacterium]|nr:NAD-dependent epimerase/dehydratase family protein [bacterium]